MCYLTYAILSVFTCIYLRSVWTLPTEFGWLVGRWNDCPQTCGRDAGFQLREVYCSERRNNSLGVVETRKVEASFCWQQKKPDSAQKCQLEPCPVWEVGEWSQCSVSCGKGFQHREVACRSDRFREELSANGCNPSQRPTSKQVCYPGISCKAAEENRLLDDERYRYLAAAPYQQWDAADILETRLDSSKPHWVPQPWSDCSTTCGPGIKTRRVECVAFQPITQNLMNLPDFECEGAAKPAEFLPCEVGQCPLPTAGPTSATGETIAPGVAAGGQNGAYAEYKWDYGDWEPCSASCLGGTQRISLRCIELSNQRTVAWKYCDAKQRPPVLSRTCNIVPCPPTWDVGIWSVCSHSCGGGTKTRMVRCVSESPGLAKDSASATSMPSQLLILPDTQCQKPKPKNQLICNNIDCPAFWRTGDWGQCSATCFEGTQRRLVVCQQLLSNGESKQHSVTTPCKHVPKPPSLQLCSLGPCPTKAPPPLPLSQHGTTTLKNFDQLQNHTKLTLRVGGVARLFEDTSVKVKCPIRNFDRTRIRWLKNGKLIKSNRRVKISKNGALRISKTTSADNGNYTCLAGTSQGHILLQFKPRLHHFTQPASLPIASLSATSNRIYEDEQRQLQQLKNSVKSKSKTTETEKFETFALNSSQKSKEKQLKQKFTSKTDYKHLASEPLRSQISKSDFKLPPKPVSDIAQRPFAKPVFEPVLPADDDSQENDVDDSIEDEKPVQQEPHTPQRQQQVLESVLKQDKQVLNGHGNDRDFSLSSALPLQQQSSDMQLPTIDAKPGNREVTNTSTPKISRPLLQILGQHLRQHNQTAMLIALSSVKDPSSVRFEWTTGDWTPCSQTCGDVDGMQVRAVQCKAEINSIAAYVDDAVCSEAGVVKPYEAKYCNKIPCPNWSTGNWSECSQSRCVKADTAMQNREVFCGFANGSIVNDTFCARRSRPRVRKECLNPECQAVWRTNEWQACTTSCGQGVQMRLIQCVWNGTRKPAGNSCKGSDRPKIIRDCNAGVPCPQGTRGQHPNLQPPPGAGPAKGWNPQNILHWRGWKELVPSV